MAPRAFNFIIDDEGDNSDGLTWPTAYTSPQSYYANESSTAGHTLAVGHNHIDSVIYAAAVTFNSPTNTGEPIALISCTQGVGSIAAGGFEYQVGISDQINTSIGAFDVSFENSWELVGLRINSGGNINLRSNNNGVINSQECLYKPGQSSDLNYDGSGGIVRSRGDTADGVNSTSASSDRLVRIRSAIVQDLTILNTTNFTSEIFVLQNSCECSGFDLSTVSTASGVELIQLASITSHLQISNWILPATFNLIKNYGLSDIDGGRFTAVNVGIADQPEFLVVLDMYGSIYSTTAITRTGNRAVEGKQISLGGPTQGIETTSACYRGAPFYTGWVGGKINAIGPVTFSIPVVMDMAALTKEQLWIEVEVKADIGSGRWVAVNDQDDPVTVGTALLVDTSDWAGVGPSFTNKLLAQLITNVATLGHFRARIGIGRPSIVGSNHLYISAGVLVT